MSGLSHTRWFWNRVRYTEAQMVEFRRLRALYRQHLAAAYGADYPLLLRLKDEKDLYEPAYSGAEPQAAAAAEVKSEALKPFMRGMASIVGVFEYRRQRRFWGKGYPNDPTALLLSYLREIFDALATAPCNATTLGKLGALREFLEAVRRGNVFQNEPKGHGSMRVLARNLVSQLTCVEEHVRAEIALESAREEFKQLKVTLSNVLDQAVHYLFHAVADKERTGLSLSLLSAPSGVVDEELQASLATREGALLKNLVQHPALLAALFPQSPKPIAHFGKPLGLLGEPEGTPFLDEKAKANTMWLDFLQSTPAQESQLTPVARKMPPGVCSLILKEAKGEGQGTLDRFVYLHGLLVTLATFQHYVEQCWRLAGFGGDQLVYERLAETITTLLTELLGFNAALEGVLKAFQAQLDSLDAEALDKQTDLAWQINYEHAKMSQQQLLKLLTDCDTTLKAILRHAGDTAARSDRLQAGLEAYTRLQGASDFLNQARRQVGLAPQSAYPGLAPQSGNSQAGGEAKAGTIQTMEALLVVLAPQTPDQVLFLTETCRDTPDTLPWSIFRGTYQRVSYLQRSERLLRMGEGMARLEQYPEYAVSSEGRAALQALKSQCQRELTRITRLSEGLYWPFHRASLRFFTSWQTVFQDNVHRLEALEARHRFIETPVSPAVLLERLTLQPTPLPPAPVEKEKPSQRIKALWAKTLEQEALLTRYEAELDEPLDPTPPAESKETDVSLSYSRRVSISSEFEAEASGADDFSSMGFESKSNR